MLHSGPMIVVLEHGITATQRQALEDVLTRRGFSIHEVAGTTEVVLGVVGGRDTDTREIELRPGVARVVPISKPFKLASREFQPQDTVVDVGAGVKIGGRRLVVIGGPCAVESREQIEESARVVAASGGAMLRGGAFKPRTSPYSFQGLGVRGLELLRAAGDAHGLPVVSEIVSTDQIDPIRELVHVAQVGARNMQNFELLKALGAVGMPVLLKRGLASTIQEWLMAAEYLLAHGARNVVLCERGIRTFETYTRNTLDVASIPVVRKLSHLPVIVDPSHATGNREHVPAAALAGVAAGADGLIVEVHPDPNEAASDGPQSLFPEQFEKLIRDITALAPVIEREIMRPARRRTPSAPRDTAVVDRSSGAMRVGFQGSRGAFSEVALENYYAATAVHPVSFTHFRDAFQALLDREVERAILPIENSLMGSIRENYDLLLEYPDLCIVGETHIRIEHSLIGLPGADESGVRQVLSQAPGISQCRDFLADHPDWQITPFYDTAASVARVKELGDPTIAAIAAARAAEHYGLVVLRQGIETNPRNYTRFVVLARDGEPADATPNMASIVFSTPDTPGALFDCMRILAERRLNLKKLESRPIHGEPWRYSFYADLELPTEPEAFTTALESLAAVTRDLRVLGTYAVSVGRSM